MADFYGRDDLRTHDSHGHSREDTARSKENVEDLGEKLARRSMSGSPRKSRYEREKIRAAARRKRTAIFGAACLAVGIFIGTSVIPTVIEDLEDRAIIGEQVTQFRKEVVGPNTHRTNDNEHYWYDYEKIAKGMSEDASEFSIDAYSAYATMGLYQANRVMENTNYGSIEGLASAQGYDSVDDWKKDQERKIVLNEEIREKQAELDSMQADVRTGQEAETQESYGGSK